MPNTAMVECSPIGSYTLHHIAKATQLEFGLDESAPLYILRLLEFHVPEFLDTDCIFELIPDEEWLYGESMPAVCIPEKKFIQIKESVYNRAFSGNNEDLRTILHNISTLLLYYYLTKDEIHSKDKIEFNIKLWQDIEFLVDLYELMLLCPKSYICNFTIDEIVKNKAISREEINKLQEAYKQSECAKESISNENP